MKLEIKLGQIAVLSLGYLHLIKLNGFRLPSVIGQLCKFLTVAARRVCSSRRHCFCKCYFPFYEFSRVLKMGH